MNERMRSEQTRKTCYEMVTGNMDLGAEDGRPLLVNG
jgi:hypothetical protein